MAEGKITITILGDGGTGGGDGTKNNNQNPAKIISERLNKLAHPIRTAGNEAQDRLTSALGGGGAATAAIGAAAMIAKEAVSTSLYFLELEYNRYFTLKEDYIGQNNMGRIKAQMASAKNMGSSLASGAMKGAVVGSAAGPVGAVIGAIAGSVLGGVTSGLKARTETEQKMEQINMQMNATNMQTAFSASRAGLINGGKGTEY